MSDIIIIAILALAAAWALYCCLRRRGSGCSGCSCGSCCGGCCSKCPSAGQGADKRQ